MKIKLIYKDIVLGVYQYIECSNDRYGNNFSISDFLSFDSNLQSILLNNDVSTLRNFVSKNYTDIQLTEYEIKSSGKNSRNNEFITDKDSEELVLAIRDNINLDIELQKEKYFQEIFNHLYQKINNPNESNTPVVSNNEELNDESEIGLSRLNEAKVAKEKGVLDPEFELIKIEINLERSELVNQLFCNSGLSDVELDCWKYLSDRNYQSPFIHLFTKQGILQQANRASLKMKLYAKKHM